jgi:MATE family multidrug resistance protein
LAQATNVLCSQAFGAGDTEQVGDWLRLSLVITTIASVPVMVSWFFVGDLMTAVGFSPRVAAMANQFAQVSAGWVWPQSVTVVWSNYFQAQHVVLPFMVVAVGFLVLNLGFNVLFVFGAQVGGLSVGGYGFVGSAMATVVANWCQLGVLVLYVIYVKKAHRPTWGAGWSRRAFSRAFSGSRLAAYVKQAGPLMLSGLLEELQMSVVSVFAAKLGTVPMATHSAMLQLFLWLTTGAYGLIDATTVRIGNHLGANQPRRARLVSQLCLASCLATGAVVAVVIISARHVLGRVYSDDPAVVDLTAQIAVLLGSCYLLLSLFFTAIATLQGLGRPGVIAVAFVLGAWGVSVPLAYVFTFRCGMGLLGLWKGLTVGYAVITLITGVAALRTDWDQVGTIYYQQKNAVEKEQGKGAETGTGERDQDGEGEWGGRGGRDRYLKNAVERSGS